MAPNARMTTVNGERLSVERDVKTDVMRLTIEGIVADNGKTVVVLSPSDVEALRRLLG